MEPGAKAKAGVVRVEEPTLLGKTLSVLLGDMLSTLFFNSLSLEKPINLSDTDFGAEQQKEFF